MQNLNSSSGKIIRVTYARVAYTVCQYAFSDAVYQNMLSDDCEMLRFSRNKLLIAHRLLLPAPSGRVRWDESIALKFSSVPYFTKKGMPLLDEGHQ